MIVRPPAVFTVPERLTTTLVAPPPEIVMLPVLAPAVAAAAEADLNGLRGRRCPCTRLSPRPYRTCLAAVALRNWISSAPVVSVSVTLPAAGRVAAADREACSGAGGARCRSRNRHTGGAGCQRGRASGIDRTTEVHDLVGRAAAGNGDAAGFGTRCGDGPGSELRSSVRQKRRQCKLL